MPGAAPSPVPQQPRVNRGPAGPHGAGSSLLGPSGPPAPVRLVPGSPRAPCSSGLEPQFADTTIGPTRRPLAPGMLMAWACCPCLTPTAWRSSTGPSAWLGCPEAAWGASLSSTPTRRSRTAPPANARPGRWRGRANDGLARGAPPSVTGRTPARLARGGRGRPTLPPPARPLGPRPPRAGRHAGCAPMPQLHLWPSHSSSIQPRYAVLAPPMQPFVAEGRPPSTPHERAQQCGDRPPCRSGA